MSEPAVSMPCRRHYRLRVDGDGTGLQQWLLILMRQHQQPLARGQQCQGELIGPAARRRAGDQHGIDEHPFSLAIALCLSAEQHQFHLEDATTLELAEEGAALCRDQGFPFWEGTALILQGWALARTGRTDEGIITLRSGLEIFRSTGAEVQLSSWYSLLAEAQGYAGQIEQGLRTVEQALSWADRTGERYYESEAYWLRGQLLRQHGDTRSAEDSYRRALDVARRQQVRIRELRAAVDLAELWRKQGRLAEARELLQSFDCIPNGAGPDLHRARRLMGKLMEVKT